MGYLPLAKSVLEALEKWTHYLSQSNHIDTFRVLVVQILPLLTDYLKTGSNIASML